MLRVILLGLMIASVVDFSLGQNVWTFEDHKYMKTFTDLQFHNPVCTLNIYGTNTEECAKLKPAVEAMVRAKRNVSNIISNDCKCERTDANDNNQCSCKCKYEFIAPNGTPVGGIRQENYEEKVWPEKKTGLQVQFRFV
uniref:Uncharacterized protein n=1 Tax=Cacopsylla melanoneura TaxID=428564 RepID=A0A8D8THJ5_9HEMI